MTNRTHDIQAETSLRRRPLEWWERRKLESNGCRSLDWSSVRLCDATDLDSVRNVEFAGAVSIGIVRKEIGSEIADARIENCVIGDYACIRGIGIHIRNCVIGRNARITDVSLIEFEPEAQCGVGTEVDVLDETGSRAVTIYPGLSAQAALLMAREPRWNERYLRPIVEEHVERLTPRHIIGDGAVIENCGELRNVCVGNEVRVSGARRLSNGMIINNAAPGRCLAYVGNGVDAENFIIEDGRADSGAIIRNCYIGQGASLEKGFSAHDSLFFANCSLENGEACAMFAGPYTVSMHKSSLLIGCQTSFMNAGSGTNQSNHMYKLGPVHWGILERGVKTSSASYLMLGAKIGAFSLLMGQHKTHPDSSQFPFSYLFGDDKGSTSVVPAMMLRSCGLLRDEKKWPTRDRRLKRRLRMLDRVNFAVLNPVTIGRIMDTLPIIRELLLKPTDDDRYLRYKGMKFRSAHLERAEKIYLQTICKYLHTRLGDAPFPHRTGEAEEWIDVAGQLMPVSYLNRAREAASITEAEEIFDEAFQNADRLELEWIGNRLHGWCDRADEIRRGAEAFDRQIEEDRAAYRDGLYAEIAMHRFD